MADSVTVTAELTGIESNQSVLGQLMDNKKVSELPLNGRQVFMLLQLSAGVVFTQQQFGATGFSGTRAWDINGQLTIHGSRANSNAFMLDGAPLGVNGAWNYAPLVDAVEEFKVSSPANDASHGLTGGGVVNMTMKSGTNQLHGLASDFVRNNIFDADRHPDQPRRRRSAPTSRTSSTSGTASPPCQRPHRQEQALLLRPLRGLPRARPVPRPRQPSPRSNSGPAISPRPSTASGAADRPSSIP